VQRFVSCLYLTTILEHIAAVHFLFVVLGHVAAGLASMGSAKCSVAGLRRGGGGGVHVCFWELRLSLC
jgi:hypothetical protein